MNIFDIIWAWISEPITPFIGTDISPPAADWAHLTWRILHFYAPPIILGHLVDRYTGVFSRRDTWGPLYFWPIYVPLAVIVKTAAFIWNNGAKGLDVVVARLSRKILLDDEHGRVYSEKAPQNSKTKTQDQWAWYVEVKDHTGTHRIRIDPLVLRNRELNVQEAIAHTFGVDANTYQPAIES